MTTFLVINRNNKKGFAKMDEKRCYELLGITKQSTDEEIKKAYRLAAKKCHPDLHLGDKEAEKHFIEISEAYRQIQEIRKKRTERFSIKKIFVAPNKTTSAEKAKNKPQNGTDIHSSVEISFEESLLGCKKTVKINREKRCACCTERGPSGICQVCQGTGKIRKTTFIDLNVPKGVQNGQSLKICGKGNVGDIGAENGDLIIALNVAKNNHYTIKGDDVYIKIELSFPEAVIGTIKRVPTIYGDIEVDIPPGTQSGTKLCLHGKGLKNDNGKLGNEYAIVSVKIPKVSNNEQIDLLKRVQKEIYDTDNERG